MKIYLRSCGIILGVIVVLFCIYQVIIWFAGVNIARGQAQESLNKVNAILTAIDNGTATSTYGQSLLFILINQQQQIFKK